MRQPSKLFPYKNYFDKGQGPKIDGEEIQIGEQCIEKVTEFKYLPGYVANSST